MMILGLLLVCATGAFTGLLIADNLAGGPDYQVTILGQNIATMNSLEIFLSGLALALLFCFGLAMLLRGRRAVHRRYAADPGLDRRAATQPTVVREPVPAPAAAEYHERQQAQQPIQAQQPTQTRRPEGAQQPTQPRETAATPDHRYLLGRQDAENQQYPQGRQPVGTTADAPANASGDPSAEEAPAESGNPLRRWFNPRN
jgi:hypothetical protein